ncbi:hypothetical protein D8770_28205, partial [Methylobacterium sp. DB1607]|nr:hypothetical protein [Methylobacterium sp. DB1607]
MSTTTHQGAVGAETMTAGRIARDAFFQGRDEGISWDEISDVSKADWERAALAAGAAGEGLRAILLRAKWIGQITTAHDHCARAVYESREDAWEAYRALVAMRDATPATPRTDSDEGTAGKEPRVFKDGDAWCCLLGENLQDGIAGFGNTPDAALRNFRERLTGNLCSVLRGALTVADESLREIARDVRGADWLLEQEAEGRGPLATIKRALELSPAPATPPGVPDSVRALSEAASPDWDTNEATPYILGPPIDGEIDRFEVIARGPHGHAKSGDAIRKWQANRMFAVAAVNFVRTLIAAQPAGQAGDAGADARTVMTEACKPWEHYTGEPPDDGSPLSGVFVAGMVYTERLLAKLLDVTHYEGGDGSEDFDADATQSLRNILIGASLWDADENCPVAATPAQPAGAVPDGLRALGDALEQTKAAADDLASVCVTEGDHKAAGALQFISGFISDQMAT